MSGKEIETEQETQTLGEFLKATREAGNISLEDVQSSTKITLHILEAIERDDFSCMPAEAFCRGFYIMYAKFLQLNPEEVLSRYLDARGLPPVSAKMQSTPPVRKSGQFSNYAEPSSISPLMSSIFALFILLAVIIGGCLYFNWNPVDYLNSKLDAIQTNVQLEEAVTTVPSQISIVTPPPGFVTEAESSDQIAAEQASEEVVVEEIVEPSDTEEEAAKEVTTPTPYHLEIYFRNNGTLTATLDKGFFIDKDFQNGQTLQWEVQESIVLDMPESVDATIRMNGIDIPLPDAEDGRRRLSLPEDLLN
jgi:cytoskeleton protein RodZ